MNKDTEAGWDLEGELRLIVASYGGSNRPTVPVAIDTVLAAASALEALRQERDEATTLEPGGWIYTDKQGDLRVTFCPEDLDPASRSTCVPFVYATAPVVGPVGEEWLFELLAAFRSGEKTAHETVAALLDAYRRGGAVVGDEARDLAHALVDSPEGLGRAGRGRLIPEDTFQRVLAFLGGIVLSRQSGSGDELLGGDGRYAELSAADEADARRCAGILAEKYDIVRIAQDYGTGDWSVVYTHPRALAVQPEKEERNG